MSENSEVEISPQPRLTRRSFLRNLGRAGLGFSAVSLAGSEVRRAVENKIETPYAVFYPFYELHDWGVDISSAELPQNHDIHWAEGVFNPTLGNNPAVNDFAFADNFIKWYANKCETDNNLKSLHYFQTHNVSLAGGGDIRPVKEDSINKALIVENVSSNVLETVLIYFAGKFGIEEVQAFKNEILGYTKKQAEGQKKGKGRLSRRGVVKAVIAIGAIIGAIKARDLISLKTLEATSSGNPPPEVRAAKRMLLRITGLLSHARPYSLINFLRNVFWAEKMLDMAEKEKSILGRKANISYQVGAFHSGLEDFLILGRDFCQTVIDAYPKTVLEEIARLNGGVRGVASTLVFKASPTIETIEKPVEERDYRPRKIIDEQLIGILKDKIQG